MMADTSRMNEQLEILLQIQDLKAQRDTLTERGAGRGVEEEEFNIDIGTAIEDVEGTIAEMEEKLDPVIRGQYQRVAAARGRAVVPVIRGICYGCFVSIPTAIASDSDSTDRILNCDHCGRFLYVIG